MAIIVNKKYIKGRKFEYECEEVLRKQFGCFLTVRSAGSKGVFDVVGFSHNFMFGIEVKSPRKGYKPTKAEIDKLKAVPKPRGYILRRGIWIREKGNEYSFAMHWVDLEDGER